ncbi:MAG: hypothetical protein KC518_13275 [Candidatus Cloacimonetes bacterium]|nr:hypothetical protein [Candidatus Cloacimonadota bacterium]
MSPTLTAALAVGKQFILWCLVAPSVALLICRMGGAAARAIPGETNHSNSTESL